MTITLILLALWLAVAFIGVRTAGRQYFHEARRADVVSAAVVIAVIVGIGVDPFRTHGAPSEGPIVPAVSVSGSAPVGTSSASDVRLGVADMFGVEFVAWQRGAIAPADYTPRGYAASVAAVKTVSPGLRSLGAIRREKLLSKNGKDALTGYEFRFDCAKGSELMGAYVDTSGKIDSIGFQAVPHGR